MIDIRTYGDIQVYAFCVSIALHKHWQWPVLTGKVELSKSNSIRNVFYAEESCGVHDFLVLAI